MRRKDETEIIGISSFCFRNPAIDDFTRISQDIVLLSYVGQRR